MTGKQKVHGGLRQRKKGISFVPKVKGGGVDWGEMARLRLFGSVEDMFSELYGERDGVQDDRKMTVEELVEYLGVGKTGVRQALVKYGFIVPGAKEQPVPPKCRRWKYRYPFTKYQVITEYGMWVYFIEKGYSVVEIVQDLYRVSGVYFLEKVVDRHLCKARLRYKQEKGEGRRERIYG